MSELHFDLGLVRAAVAAGRLSWSRHAVARMQERAFTRADVLEGLREGQVIESYADDAPYPSALVLGFVRGRPVHIVVALDSALPEGHIITVYEPSSDEFGPDWRTRRTQ